MGTNFYWLERFEENADWESKSDFQVHIGKRIFMGLYCSECGILKCKNSVAHSNCRKYFFGEECPNCNNKFNDHALKFTWTMLSHKSRILSMIQDKKKVIVDEYGDKFSAKEFMKEIEKVIIDELSTEHFS
jgi:hypothetical protein